MLPRCWGILWPDNENYTVSSYIWFYLHFPWLTTSYFTIPILCISLFLSVNLYIYLSNHSLILSFIHFGMAVGKGFWWLPFAWAAYDLWKLWDLRASMTICCRIYFENISRSLLCFCVFLVFLFVSWFWFHRLEVKHCFFEFYHGTSV